MHARPSPALLPGADHKSSRPISTTTILWQQTQPGQPLSTSSFGYFAKDELAGDGDGAGAGAGAKTTTTPLDFLGELEHGASSAALAGHLKGSDTPTLRFSRDYAAELNRTEG